MKETHVNTQWQYVLHVYKISVTTDRGFVRVSSFCHRETEVEVSEGKKNIWDSNDELFAHQLDKRKASKAIGAAKNKDTRFEKICKTFPSGASGKELACQCRRHKRQGLDRWVGEIPLEMGMATHSTILAWRIPWTEEPGGLQSTESHRVRHDWSVWAHTHARHSCDWMVVCM